MEEFGATRIYSLGLGDDDGNLEEDFMRSDIHANRFRTYFYSLLVDSLSFVHFVIFRFIFTLPFELFSVF